MRVIKSGEPRRCCLTANSQLEKPPYNNTYTEGGILNASNSAPLHQILFSVLTTLEITALI